MVTVFISDWSGDGGGRGGTRFYEGFIGGGCDGVGGGGGSGRGGGGSSTGGVGRGGSSVGGGGGSSGCGGSSDSVGINGTMAVMVVFAVLARLVVLASMLLQEV